MAFSHAPTLAGAGEPHALGFCPDGRYYDVASRKCLLTRPAEVFNVAEGQRVFQEFGVVRPSYILGPIGSGGPNPVGVVAATNADAVRTTQNLASTASPAMSSIGPVRAQQSTLNTGVNPTAAAAADAAAATLGYAVVQVPAMYAGTGRGFADANRARSSIQDYFFQPTFVSQVLPVSRDAHAVAIAATLAEPALLH